MRPRIVDANFESGVAAQGREKQELVSRTWDIIAEQVLMTVYGGYINVSELLIEMISSSLDMVVSHMNRRLENLSELAVVTQIGMTSDTVTLTDSNVMKALGEARIDLAHTGSFHWRHGSGSLGASSSGDLAGRRVRLLDQRKLWALELLQTSGTPSGMSACHSGIRYTLVGQPVWAGVYERGTLSECPGAVVFGRQIARYEPGSSSDPLRLLLWHPAPEERKGS